MSFLRRSDVSVGSATNSTSDRPPAIAGRTSSYGGPTPPPNRNESPSTALRRGSPGSPSSASASTRQQRSIGTSASRGSQSGATPPSRRSSPSPQRTMTNVDEYGGSSWAEVSMPEKQRSFRSLLSRSASPSIRASASGDQASLVSSVLSSDQYHAHDDDADLLSGIGSDDGHENDRESVVSESTYGGYSAAGIRTGGGAGGGGGYNDQYNMMPQHPKGRRRPGQSLMLQQNNSRGYNNGYNPSTSQSSLFDRSVDSIDSASRGAGGTGVNRSGSTAPPPSRGEGMDQFSGKRGGSGSMSTTLSILKQKERQRAESASRRADLDTSSADRAAGSRRNLDDEEDSIDDDHDDGIYGQHAVKNNNNISNAAGGGLASGLTAMHLRAAVLYQEQHMGEDSTQYTGTTLTRSEDMRSHGSTTDPSKNRNITSTETSVASGTDTITSASVSSATGSNAKGTHPRKKYASSLRSWKSVRSAASTGSWASRSQISDQVSDPSEASSSDGEEDDAQDNRSIPSDDGSVRSGSELESNRFDRPTSVAGAQSGSVAHLSQNSRWNEQSTRSGTLSFGGSKRSGSTQLRQGSPSPASSLDNLTDAGVRRSSQDGAGPQRSNVSTLQLKYGNNIKRSPSPGVVKTRQEAAASVAGHRLSPVNSQQSASVVTGTSTSASASMSASMSASTYSRSESHHASSAPQSVLSGATSEYTESSQRRPSEGSYDSRSRSHDDEDYHEHSQDHHHHHHRRGRHEDDDHSHSDYSSYSGSRSYTTEGDRTRDTETLDTSVSRSHTLSHHRSVDDASSKLSSFPGSTVQDEEEDDDDHDFTTQDGGAHMTIPSKTIASARYEAEHRNSSNDDDQTQETSDTTDRKNRAAYRAYADKLRGSLKDHRSDSGHSVVSSVLSDLPNVPPREQGLVPGSNTETGSKKGQSSKSYHGEDKNLKETALGRGTSSALGSEMSGDLSMFDDGGTSTQFDGSTHFDGSESHMFESMLDASGRQMSARSFCFTEMTDTSGHMSNFPEDEPPVMSPEEEEDYKRRKQDLEQQRQRILDAAFATATSKNAAARGVGVGVGGGGGGGVPPMSPASSHPTTLGDSTSWSSSRSNTDGEGFSKATTLSASESRTLSKGATTNTSSSSYYNSKASSSSPYTSTEGTSSRSSNERSSQPPDTTKLAIAAAAIRPSESGPSGGSSNPYSSSGAGNISPESHNIGDKKPQKSDGGDQRASSPTPSSSSLLTKGEGSLKSDPLIIDHDRKKTMLQSLTDLQRLQRVVSDLTIPADLESTQGSSMRSGLSYGESITAANAVAQTNSSSHYHDHPSHGMGGAGGMGKILERGESNLPSTPSSSSENTSTAYGEAITTSTKQSPSTTTDISSSDTSGNQNETVRHQINNEIAACQKLLAASNSNHTSTYDGTLPSGTTSSSSIATPSSVTTEEEESSFSTEHSSSPDRKGSHNQGTARQSLLQSKGKRSGAVPSQAAAICPAAAAAQAAAAGGRRGDADAAAGKPSSEASRSRKSYDEEEEEDQESDTGWTSSEDSSSQQLSQSVDGESRTSSTAQRTESQAGVETAGADTDAAAALPKTYIPFQGFNTVNTNKTAPSNNKTSLEDDLDVDFPSMEQRMSFRRDAPQDVAVAAAISNTAYDLQDDERTEDEEKHHEEEDSYMSESQNSTSTPPQSITSGYSQSTTSQSMYSQSQHSEQSSHQQHFDALMKKQKEQKMLSSASSAEFTGFDDTTTGSVETPVLSDHERKVDDDESSRGSYSQSVGQESVDQGSYFSGDLQHPHHQDHRSTQSKGESSFDERDSHVGDEMASSSSVGTSEEEYEESDLHEQEEDYLVAGRRPLKKNHSQDKNAAGASANVDPLDVEGTPSSARTMNSQQSRREFMKEFSKRFDASGSNEGMHQFDEIEDIEVGLTGDRAPGPTSLGNPGADDDSTYDSRIGKRTKRRKQESDPRGGFCDLFFTPWWKPWVILVFVVLVVGAIVAAVVVPMFAKGRDDGGTTTVTTSTTGVTTPETPVTSNEGSGIGMWGDEDINVITPPPLSDTSRLSIFSNTEWKVMDDIDHPTLSRANDGAGSSIALASNAQRLVVGSPLWNNDFVSTDDIVPEVGLVTIYDTSSSTSLVDGTIGTSARSTTTSTEEQQKHPIVAQIFGTKPSERLGVAVSTNDDGSIVAIGCLMTNDAGSGDDVMVTGYNVTIYSVVGEEVAAEERRLENKHRSADEDFNETFGLEQIGESLVTELADYSMVLSEHLRPGLSISLSASGDRVAVGIPHHFGTGEIFVYELVNSTTSSDTNDASSPTDKEATSNTLSTWRPMDVQSNLLTRASENDRYGESIALSGDGTVLAAGAPNRGDSGRAVIFKLEQVQRPASVQRSNTEEDEAEAEYISMWNTDAFVTSTDIGMMINNEDVQEFGKTVALNYNGSIVAIGAPASNDSTGLVAVLQRQETAVPEGNEDPLMNRGTDPPTTATPLSATTWLLLGDPLWGNHTKETFGTSLSLSHSGTRMAVGAPGRQHMDRTLGATLLYLMSSLTDEIVVWEQAPPLIGHGLGSDAGYAVSMNGDGLYVASGLPYRSSCSSGDTGDGNDAGTITCEEPGTTQLYHDSESSGNSDLDVTITADENKDGSLPASFPECVMFEEDCESCQDMIQVERKDLRVEIVYVNVSEDEARKRRNVLRRRQLEDATTETTPIPEEGGIVSVMCYASNNTVAEIPKYKE